MTHPDYGRAFAMWRAAAEADWTAYVTHPFVEGMGDGSLPRAAFLHYLVQDYVFLVHFARAWALGVVKAETAEEMRAAAATVDGLINHEMALHVTVCAEAGIPEAALFSAVESPANLAYTRYVLDAGHSGDFADLVAALAPCVMGYGEIGARLAETAAADTAYRPWIDSYADEGYQQLCRDVGALIDGALERRIGADFAASPRWDRLSGRFAMATRLEVGFWQMGLEQG
ncbi:thiaminase II [Tropicimonas sp. IMCC34043]|uniref:thiaminase II n=1 Tax=Tropicimonas sp. IMCC34043 TaxID=2248760 RepID=UPI000E22BFDA|nr:thiaminase II [Tropicimonas sp. IMCC34043]